MNTKLPYDIVADLGKEFKAYRKALRISQKQVKAKTGIATSTLSLFENGKGQGLSLMHFVTLLEVVGLSESLEPLIPDVSGPDLAKLWKLQNKGRKKGTGK